MAPRGFSLEMLKDRETVRRLTAASGNVKDTRALHRRIGVKLLQKVLLGFRNEKTPEGKPWAKLRPSTIRRRRKGSSKGGRPRILQDTGSLMKSFSFSANRVQVRVGSADPRARIHQLGKRAILKREKIKDKKKKGGQGFLSGRGGGIPARPMLPQRKTAERISAQVADGYMREIVRRANRGQKAPRP